MASKTIHQPGTNQNLRKAIGHLNHPNVYSFASSK